VLSVRFEPSVSSLSQSFARTLLAETQVVLPERAVARGAHWVNQEADTNGQYIARYEIDPAAGKGSKAGGAVQTLQKSKARYLPLQQQSGTRAVEVPMLIHPKGTRVARIDTRKGALVSLNGTESQVMTVQGKQVAYAKTTLRVRLLGEAKVDAAELAALERAAGAPGSLGAAVSLSPRQSREASEEVLQRSELGSATVDSLLADLAKAEKERVSDGEQTALYLKF
jgi:hypothetical protein